MFVGEDRSLPQSGAPERGFTQVGSCLTHKHQTRLERLARDAHSYLLRKSVNYGRKQFYSTGLDSVWGFTYNTLFFRNLRMWSISQSVFPWKAFPVQSMFASKAGAYLTEAPFRCSTLRYAHGLICKHQTRLKRLACCSLLLLTLIYWAHLQVTQKIKCYEYGPCAIKLFTAEINTILK